MRASVLHAILVLAVGRHAAAQENPESPPASGHAAEHLGLGAWAELAAVLAHDVHATSVSSTQAEMGVTLRLAAEYRLPRRFGTFARLAGSIAKVYSARGAIGLENWGNTRQVDLMGGVNWRPPLGRAGRESFTFHVAGGGAWVMGPEGTSPYPLIEEQDQPFGIWEAGLSLRIDDKPIEGVFAFQSLRVLPATEEHNGRVSRLILGLRFGS